jgi:hypothetical protein
LAGGCQGVKGGTRTPGPLSCTVFVRMTRVTQTWRILCRLASRASTCSRAKPHSRMRCLRPAFARIVAAAKVASL